MKTKLLGITLFALTLGAVAVYPSVKTATQPTPPPIKLTQNQATAPVVDVVFVLDTTGSMGGLIQTAKEKIWSIATTMTSAQQTPNIRIGLVAFRDRGDEYVTRIVDLSDDLDSVYASLMDFQANGGGDGPESVNKALYDSIHGISWSQEPNAYQVVFLLGDAPPHMDYQDEVQFPEILKSAAERGIIVNTIQCGNSGSTESPWRQIASLGNGRFFQVEQAGSAVAYSSPYDEEIASLSAKIDDTRMYYGSRAEKAEMASKEKATAKLNERASIASRARRGAFNTSAAGKTNMLGENELVDAIASGRVDLDSIKPESLPSALQSMAPAAQKEVIAQAAEERSILADKIKTLAKKRGDYIALKVEADGGADDSLDHKLYDAVREQAGEAGLEYKDGPKY